MDEKERKPFTKRIWFLRIAIILVFLFLGSNLWYLQISQASYYETKAKGNALQIVTIPATRGDIIDKNGKILVTSVPKFALTLDWLDLQQAKNYDWKDVVRRLASYVKPYWANPAESEELITEDILVLIQNHQWERYRPLVILKDISPVLQAIVAEHQNELPGVGVEAMPERIYPENSLAGQLLGYIREISDTEIEKFNQDPEAQKDGFQYAQGDLVGKMGVEKSYDYWLRGKEGIQQVEVDNNARPLAKQVLQNPQPGGTVQLTIDADLQRVVENTMNDVLTNVQRKHPDAKAGAAVVIDVNTGKILAMASQPAMNPNDLIGVISEDTAEKYFRSKEAASFNRALSGLYPPGSTFKPLTAAAALQSGVVTPNEAINDVMSSLGSASDQAQGFPEWSGYSFGMVDLYRGLALSSDIYFQVIGRRVFDANPELIRQVSHEFGLGVLTGVDLPGDAQGIAPSAEWKKSYFQPDYDKQRDEKLKAIEENYTAKLAAAADDKTRQKLLQSQEAEKKQVQVWYLQMINQFVNWKPYDSYNNAIGQGYNAYTILQLTNFVATLVNGGKHYKPYIVDKITDPVAGTVIKENKPELLNMVSISPDNLEIVKQGMARVTTGEGTAAFLFADVPEFTGGAKTGTAQIGSKNTMLAEVYNGLFVAFAPYDNPQIAFAGVIEYGGHGGDTAGYVAKAAIMKYFGWNSK
ncbi:MAG TPA: penicillin-binding protein 2 [Desulfitobacteriaceae bacterium]|nr:penicillin-binding protein 2 [Desulfitobacteriaceae bacterium]